MNQFKIYKSSAGSGKTFTLVKEYLRLVLNAPGEYKHILALTFTNKANEEMKTRIIGELIRLSKNKNEDLKKLLQDELPKINIQVSAQLALDNILHDYSNFSVSTIDSFFNRIIRALAREINLPLRLDIQLDMEEVIAEITGQLMLDIGTDKELADWLTDFTIQKLREDKGWNIEAEIHNITYELFKEKSIDNKSHSRIEIREFFSELKSIKARFETQMKTFGDKAMKVIGDNGFSLDDFSYKQSGVAGYFEKIRTKNGVDRFIAGTRVHNGAESSESWCSKTHKQRDLVLALVENHLSPMLNQILDYSEKEFSQYIGAVEVLKRIFLLGIVEDLKKKLASYRDENNLLLISDTPKLLGKVINEEEAPFVYEKSGNRFRHFLVDEFQDTSDLQWKNLLPLVINSLSAGNFSMVVGDVKQSIYRWRSGNMNLLASEIKQHLSAYKSITSEENLDTNYRSKKEIINFNNEFFEIVPLVINETHEFDEEHLLRRAYSDDVIQKIASKNGTGGRVEIVALADETEGEEKISWKDAARQKLLDTIQDVLKRGYSFGDVAILVRNNRDGDDIASLLIANHITQVISPDSLLLNRSPEIRFMISLFRFLDDNRNQIAAAEVLFHYIDRKKNNDVSLHEVFSEASQLKKAKKKSTDQVSLFNEAEFNDGIFYKLLPEEFTRRLPSLSRMQLYELCEELISIFGLRTNNAYLLRFLDLVLEYTAKHNSSLKSFLDWWDESPSAQNASVITSEDSDAIHIMTIHKSKGLQFPIVIVPFANWSISPKTGEVLWIEADDEPFKDFGKLPVGMVNNLKKSVFKEGYEEEVVLTTVDNVNLLYVAFTRAEEELYVFLQQSSSGEMNNIGKMISGVIGRNEEWKSQFAEEGKLILGDATISSKQKKADENKFQLREFFKLKWQEKIRLSLKSDELLELLDKPMSEAINYGVLAHRVLSVIRNISDIDKAVDRVFFEGLINSEEKEKLKTEIHSLLAGKEIARFFSDEWEVMAEREIILQGGEILRPDRVLIKDNSAIVIDFKTGKELPSHRKQINSYAEALIKMKYRSVEKYLVYIAERKIVKVD